MMTAEEELRVTKEQLKAAMETIASLNQTVNQLTKSNTFKKMKKMLEKHAGSDQNGAILARIDSLAEKMDNLAVEHSSILHQRKMEEMAAEFSAKLEELKTEHQKKEEALMEELDTLRKQLKEKDEELEDKDEETVPAASYKCPDCLSAMCTALRFDGVSASCFNCKSASIVGTLQDGYKWITIADSSNGCGWCQHFQQIEYDTEFGEEVKCRFCGVVGPCRDASHCLALLITDKDVKITVDAVEKSKYFCGVVSKMDNIEKAVNSNTETVGKLVAQIENMKMAVYDMQDKNESRHMEIDTFKKDMNAINTSVLKCLESQTNTQLTFLSDIRHRMEENSEKTIDSRKLNDDVPTQNGLPILVADRRSIMGLKEVKVEHRNEEHEPMTHSGSSHNDLFMSKPKLTVETKNSSQKNGMLAETGNLMVPNNVSARREDSQQMKNKNGPNMKNMMDQLVYVRHDEYNIEMKVFEPKNKLQVPAQKEVAYHDMNKDRMKQQIETLFGRK